MSQELKGTLNNALNLNGAMQSSGNLRGQFQLGGGGGGTTDYEDLSNKPSINGHTLEGDSDTADLQLDYEDLLNKPVIPDVTNYYTKTETDTLLDGKVDDSQLNPNIYSDSSDGYQMVTRMQTYPEIRIQRTRIGPYYVQDTIDSMLAEKADTDDLAAVATSGDYDDLLNKPELATVATSGDYDDLINKPSIPSFDVTDISSDFTITKTSGNWSVDSISAYRSGKTVQIVITMTGNGSSVSAGSNGFVGTITEGPLPAAIVRLVGYYNNCPVMMQIEPDGSVTGRVLATSVTVTSSGTLPLSGTYITND